MDAYAVVETGGKQYRVAKGDVLEIERVAGEPESALRLDRVLAVSDGTTLKVGAPLVAGASVEARIVAHLRGPKVVAFKKKRRKGYEKKIGHRQGLTRVRVSEISAG